MKGTELPEMPSGAEWKIGGEAQVSWQVRNNHGGGYSYRLCPAAMPLTEECFQANHLEFVADKAGLQFADGSIEMIQPVHVSLAPSLCVRARVGFSSLVSTGVGSSSAKLIQP